MSTPHWSGPMSDTAERLRMYARQFEDQHAPQTITIAMREAADEIERQRTEVKILAGKVGKLEVENFSLASWQCEFTDGKTGLVASEGGSTYCAMAKREAALRAALTTPPSPWKPIDEPPSRAMRVLLFSPAHYNAQWDGADYGIRVAYFSDGEWRDQGTNHDAFEYDTPSHWMPLPTPPPTEPRT